MVNPVPIQALESSPSRLALRAACLVGAALLCVPGIALLSKIWSREEYFGHGFLLPLAAAYLAWERRAALGAAFSSGHAPALGPALVLGAAALEVSAVLGDVVFAAGVGVPVLLGATLFAVAGWPLLRACALPLGFLTLMVPPPGFLATRLLFQLKLLVTALATALLQAMGQPVHAEGSVLAIPGHTLFVADACSGLTSIVTMTPLAVIVAYFLSWGVWRRALVVLSVIPLAIGANLIRIVGTVLTVDRHGIEFSQGLLHEGFGVTTYILGTAALVLLARVLR